MAEIIRPHQICFHVKVSLSKETSPSCFFNHFSKVVHVFLAVTGVGVKSSSLAPSSFFFTGVVSCLAIFRNGFSMTEAMGFRLPLPSRDGKVLRNWCWYHSSPLILIWGPNIIFNGLYPPESIENPMFSSLDIDSYVGAQHQNQCPGAID